MARARDRLVGFILAASLLPLNQACQYDYQTRDWSKYEGPGKEYFQREEVELPFISDPLEPMNRGISAVNYGILVYVIGPFAWGYRHIVPEAARDAIGRAFENLRYPGRLVNNLLQGKFDGAGRETERFFVNSTVGVLGLFDPAKSLWDIKPSKEDTGQTFHEWGWNDSSFFVMPLLGPSTIRDGVGRVGDYFLEPLHYVSTPYNYAQYVDIFNTLSDIIEPLKALVETNYDTYELGKLIYVLNREMQNEDYESKSEDTGETETLESIFFKPDDPDWKNKSETYEIVHPGTGKPFKYTLWLQPSPAPLVYCIPGTGGHRLGNSSLAMSEIAYENGRSAVTISSALNFEFISSGLTAAVPGYMPSDSHDTHVALDAISKDIERRFPGRVTTSTVAGLSLGAMTALYIAAEEKNPSNKLMKFSGYMAIDCPISLAHAVQQLDRYYNTPMQFQPEEREGKLNGLYRKVLDLASSGSFQPTEALPFQAWEARYLIGLSFRLATMFAIHQTQSQHDIGVLETQYSDWRRNMSYRECGQFSFMEYLYAFVLPYYCSVDKSFTFDDAGADRFLAACDLRSIGDAIKDNERVRYFSNKNDPLIRPEDLEWVTRTFGDRAHLFETGGHMGNLTQKDVRAAVKLEGDELLRAKSGH